eukprot:TRINITY_DN6661_c0_g2_i3.p1 TRINITY_DN6661_c0_g2~~TRINITY_DN6661_c0_g2_i3.p1  ORF type:complete len:170 (+),score=50.72 TRINITY_DN6661_c0_g2_i3:40-549(+)
MGNSASLPPQDITRLEKDTSFSQKQIKRIYRRFRKLDTTNKGFVTEGDISKLPEISKNPLGHRIVKTLTSVDQPDAVEFDKFIKALSVYHSNDTEGKLQLLFWIYDVDEDGAISLVDLYSVLKSLVAADLNDLQLKEIVDKTFLDADKDRDGKLNYLEFKSLLTNFALD